MTVERTGPTSSMSWKNTMNAMAVHSTDKVSTEAITLADGQCEGIWAIPTGRYAIAVRVSAAEMTPRPGTSVR